MPLLVLATHPRWEVRWLSLSQGGSWPCPPAFFPSLCLKIAGQHPSVSKADVIMKMMMCICMRSFSVEPGKTSWRMCIAGVKSKIHKKPWPTFSAFWPDWPTIDHLLWDCTGLTTGGHRHLPRHIAALQKWIAPTGDVQPCPTDLLEICVLKLWNCLNLVVCVRGGHASQDLSF